MGAVKRPRRRSERKRKNAVWRQMNQDAVISRRRTCVLASTLFARDEFSASICNYPASPRPPSTGFGVATLSMLSPQTGAYNRSVGAVAQGVEHYNSALIKGLSTVRGSRASDRPTLPPPRFPLDS